MQYIITAYDGENALERRMAARPAIWRALKPSVTTFRWLTG